MNFRSFADLYEDIIANSAKLPRDVDAVVGIPRSGMLPATIIALHLNVPLADLDGFLEGRLFSCGTTRRRAAFDRSAGECGRILVVDDSVSSGRSMADAITKLKEKYPDITFFSCGVYGVRQDSSDLILQVVPLPRAFQWNLFHHSLLEMACVDIDGVLCADPTNEENDDGERYARFIEAARPFMLPTKPVKYLVTCRLEKYRSATERWLAEHGVIYDELIMMDLPNMEARRKAGNHGEYKASVYSRCDAQVFIESDRAQAAKIAELSGKPVICVDGWRVVKPSLTSVAGNIRSARKVMGRLSRVLIGPEHTNRLKKWLAVENSR